MSHRGAAGVDNTTRRKWDKEEYAAKAAVRLRSEADASDEAKRAKVSKMGFVNNEAYRGEF
jgi:hypothetical protein